MQPSTQFIHSTHQKGYQSRLLIIHSKGGWCNFWGLLHCDDRRSPWWATRDEPQRGRSRFDTVMFSMNFNCYAGLAIFFIIPFCSVRFFCFLTRHLINYTSVNCLWFLLSSVSLQSNWAWKTLKFGLWNLLRNFILNSWKRKKARVVRERVGHEQFCGWCDGELLCTLIEHALSTNDIAR